MKRLAINLSHPKSNSILHTKEEFDDQKEKLDIDYITPRMK